MAAAITLGMTKFSDLKIDVLTQSNFTKAVSHKKLHFLNRSFPQLLSYLRPVSITQSFNQRKKYNNFDFKRLLLYKATSNYFKSICKSYDAIHIHGISPYTYEALDFCLKNNVKGIITLHGVNYLNASIGISNAQIEKEKYFIRKTSEASHLTLTVISKGIKKRIIQSLNINPNNIEVVPNFHDFNDECIAEKLDIRKKHNIPQNAKIILSVGNYSENKNQKELVEAFEILNDPEAYLFLIGSNTEKIVEIIDNYNSKQRILPCGHINKSHLPHYYINSNILAVTSISEGFGLPMIEALYYGLPVITFSDIDAVEDIFEQENLALVFERSTKTYAKVLKNALDKSWDKDTLKKSTQKFDSEIILNQYFSILKKR